MNIPNTITLLRIFLVPLIVFLYLQGAWDASIWLFLAAGMSDALDGFIARRFNMKTYLGSILDPLADKMLITASAVTLAWVELIPAWLAAAVVMRDLVIIAGAIAYYVRAGSIEMAPTLLGKVSTCLQFTLIFVVLGNRTGLTPVESLLPYLYWATLFTTVISGVHYIIVWGRKGSEFKVKVSGR